MTDKDNSLFINPEPGVHDGCFIYTEPRCPVKVAELNARLAALPEIPSQDYQVKSICMDLLRPTKTDEEWRRMMRKIYEWRKHIVWMEVPESSVSKSYRPF